MNQEQFDALVQRLEGFARQQPASYKLRVGLLAVLGYAYIFSVLLGLFLVFGLIVLLGLYSQRMNPAMIQLGIVVLVPIVVVVRSLWISFPAPLGLSLSRQQVPRLFALVDELTAQLQVPRFHHILLTDELNAAVVQRPRFGFLGWQQNYLLIGFPLMQALSQSQFRAVLAHELAHLSGNHSRFNGWIYRVQKTYDRILARLQQSGQDRSSFLFDRFFNWYAPFFGAYSFVLRRMNEYEADRCAAEFAGAKEAAEALINLAVKARFLDITFWPSIYKQANHLIEPPSATFTSMFNALRTGITAADATQWINQALAEKTSNADTQPCLAERLSALGYLTAKQQKLSLPISIKVSAAEQLLGDVFKPLTAHFNLTWKLENETPWRQRYVYAQEVQRQLQVLEEKAEQQLLTDAEAWSRACWTVEMKGNIAAIALFQTILSTHPNHADANYALGQILLQLQDGEGIGYIERAMNLEPENIISGCELIDFFFKQQGNREKAKTYQERAQKYYQLVLMARQERSFVKESDEFQPHNLSADVLESLHQQLSNYAQLQEAYLVQKVVKNFPKQPFYVLGVRRRRGSFELDSNKYDHELVNRVADEVKLPSTAYIIILNKNTQILGKKLRQIENSAIYKSLKNF